MKNSWYYARDGAQKGPVSRDDLQLALTRGEIDRQALVWCEGMPQWQTLESVEGLQSLLEHGPPPLPQQPPPLLPHQPPPLLPQASAPPAAAGSAVANPPDRSGHGEDRSETDRRRRSGKGKAVVTGWLGRRIASALWLWLFSRPLVVLVLVLVPCLVVVAYTLSPPKPEPSVPRGQVRIDANPWGQIKWIRGPGGINVDLPELRTTPFVTTLPVGNYQAQVDYPHAQASEHCDLRVQPNQLATCWLDLAPVDAKSYFQKIGW